jgi:hypothetical protein
MASGNLVKLIRSPRYYTSMVPSSHSHTSALLLGWANTDADRAAHTRSPFALQFLDQPILVYSVGPLHVPSPPPPAAQGGVAAYRTKMSAPGRAVGDTGA